MADIDSQELSNIKKLLKEGKVTIGTELSVKMLKNGNLARVYASANTSKSVVNDLEYYAKLSNTEFVQLKIANNELGTLCRKPFSISVIGIIKK
ncbi:ribosomal L7Ae/L30e/S12e/Gadd45 family protein [Candidatus Woesearchaeota archaeon]|nr:ribosomal L7Ae/L30e/S12e/Gadd45 family protein [Candidatus Woesearchaeota archaeon]